MKTNDLEIWGNSIIEKVKADRLLFNAESLEFSIFYSPLRKEPRLMIIGDNPGGKPGELGLYHIPKIHEYVDPRSGL